MKICFYVAMFLVFSTLSFAKGKVATFTVSDIEKLIVEKNITTIESLIESLPEKLRTNYVLMHTSLSLQKSSYQEPRVILYSESGDFLMAFNGGSLEGADRVEIMQFDLKKSTFDAHEIVFHKDAAPKIEHNPQSCTRCHGGSDLRPNWSSYDFWPGAYGSNDDHLFGRVASGSAYLSADPTEYREMEKFKKSYTSHARYRHLINLADNYSYTGKYYGEIVRDKMSEKELMFESRQKIFRMNKATNENLTFLLGKLNQKRLVRIWQAMPEYRYIKYALLGFFSCEHFEDFVPAEFLKFKPRDAASENIENSYLQSSPFYFDQYFDAFFNRLGYDTKFWDMNFNLSYFDDTIAGKFTSPLSIEREFMFEIASHDKELKKILTSYKSGITYPARTAGTVSCNDVKEKSLRDLRLLVGLLDKEKKKNTSGDIFSEKCMTCHANATMTKYPFDEKSLREAFKKDAKYYNDFEYRLSEDTPQEKRMPKNSTITDDERKAILRYLKSLRD